MYILVILQLAYISSAGEIIALALSADKGFGVGTFFLPY